MCSGQKKINGGSQNSVKVLQDTVRDINQHPMESFAFVEMLDFSCGRFQVK